MTLTTQDVEKLRAFFPASDHEFLRSFCYIREEAICNRIEEIDPAWSMVITDKIQRGEATTSVTVALTIKGVTREGIGSAETKIGEPEKSAATDALKRAARLFGVGRYLLGIPNGTNSEKDLAKWLAAQQPQAAPPDKPKADTPPEIAKPFADAGAQKKLLDWCGSNGVSKLSLLSAMGLNSEGDIAFWEGSKNDLFAKLQALV